MGGIRESVGRAFRRAERQEAARQASGAGTGGRRISRRAFQQATGVNPTTGERRRRRRG